MKKVLIVSGFLAMFLGATAQEKPLKIGYTNVDYLVASMPESKQIEADLKIYKDQLDKQLESKVKEFRTKYEAYEKGASMMTEVIRADKEKELQDMNAQIEAFQKNAEQSLQEKQGKLMKPVLEKIQKAIDDVAIENDYTYILSSDGAMGQVPIILYGPDNLNLSDLVLKKMGVTPPAQQKAATPGTTPTETTPTTTTPSNGAGVKDNKPSPTPKPLKSK
jgi:outer membrane protein